MNRKILFLCLFCSMLIATTWQGIAQTNTTRENAQEITTGEQIISQLTPGTVEHLWYKLSVTAGKWYEIPHPPYALEIYKGSEPSSMYNYSYNDSYPDFRAIQFQATETGFYYLERWYNSAVGDRLEWSVIEVTDNRVCSNAETVQIGSTTDVPTGQRERWYKAAHQANKYYVAEGDLSLQVFQSCGGTALANNRQVYRAESSADMFFKLTGAGAGGTLTLKEIPVQTNTTKETALSLTLGQAVEYSHIFGQSLCFKVDLEEGKAYEIIADINQFYHSPVSVSDPEGNSMPGGVNESVSPAGASRWFTAPSTGEFYIYRNIYDYSYVNPELWSMVVTEITDARVCNNAIVAAENQTMSYHHKDYLSHWWKIDLEAGNTYLVDFVNKNGSSSKIGVFAECGDENPIEQSNESFSFVASKTGTYYLHASSTYRQYDEELSSFAIRKIANQNNFDCASALSIEPGNMVTTAHSFGNNLWYKINVKAGKAYEIDGRQRASSWSDVVKVFTACGQTRPVYSGSSSPLLLYLEPQTDGVYYICWSGDASTATFAWQVNEVNDNRVCSMAETAPTGQDITITRNSHANNTYWYRLTMQGGKVYEIDFSNAYKYSWYSNDYMEFYGQCGPDQQYSESITKSRHLLTPAKDSVLYLKIKPSSSQNSPLVWRINELNSADNRLCSYATAVSLNTGIQTDHTTGYVKQWYKITLESDKIYEVDVSQAGNNLYYYKGNICNEPPSYLDPIAPGNKFLIAPAETSEYYILSLNEEINTNFTWSIKETEGDNRLRAFATEITPGTEFSVDHTESNVRWYKVNMAEGALYTINFRVNYQNVDIFNDNNDSALKYGYGQTFTFLAKTGGMYYLKFYNTNAKPVFNCTVEGIIDNRSCLYPVPATIGTTASGTGLDSDGRWFSVNLEGGGIYEFDFSNINQNATTTSRIYAACTDSKPLDEGKSEKILFKPAQAGVYLVHISTENGVTSNDAWSWSFNTATADNRLCEYATTVNPGDTTTIDLNNGIGRRWYKVDIEGGKFYEMGTVDLQYARMEVYAACGGEPLAGLGGNKKVINSENDATLYVKVSDGNNARWYIKEVPADGLLCHEGIEIELGQQITTTGSGIYLEFTPAGYQYPVQFYNGTWYKISNLEPGIYEARLEQWQESEEDENFGGTYEEGYYYAPFYYVSVFGSCDLSTSYIGSAGHGFNRGRFRFQVDANKTYYLLLANEMNSPSFTWELVKTGDVVAKGIIRVSLEDSNNQPLANVSDADIYIYRKQGNTLTLADHANWDPEADNFVGSTFSSLSLDEGTYLVYIDNVPGHLPGWYQNAGVWEDATEINLTSQGTRLKYTPKAIPTDISTGDITISGTVYDNESGGQITIQDIDISIYRERSQPQGVRRQTAPAPYRVVNSTYWELIARLKTDAQGHYQLSSLPEGRYMIVVDLPGYATENGGIVLNAAAGQSYANNNFEADESSMTIKTQITGLKDLNLSGINLYPNPFDKEIVVEGAKDSWLQIFGTNGNRIYTRQLTSEKESVLLNLSSGIYYFRIEKDGNSKSFVVVKK